MPMQDIPDITHLNRLNDVFFKALLGSEERKTLTLNFINAILNREGSNAFTSITFSDKEIVPPRIDRKLSFLDVLVKMDDGTRVHVEVQVLMDEYMVNRSLYYWGRIYSRELDKGDLYADLRPVIKINLLDFNQFPQYDTYVNTYHIMNDDTHDILTNHLEMHFIELKKIHISDIKKLKRSERWIAYFSPNFTDQERRALAMSDTAIREAMDYEKQFATNNELKSAYWEHERTMRDIASALYSREKAGQERGERIGQERGEKIGDKTGRQALSELLQKLLQEGGKEDINRVLQDNEYQEKLLREYHLK
ncbi:Rpn family recombination-promoting nuclease/putative transposase [Megasphaera sp. AM44-1BH]|uniref:Rpn family recombination-promoting nuclease/putative transposase n=1 Tax=Megasphaera sp. AM44-1BH TaxID=2292358 RepID=UPI000E47D4EE|nr:Rpn family recombination-promoting nuclease/putative transposase [Megasphaera sp. AM44-1BH]RHA14922.1 Rpn family recombination-promoting nuclease/putative transposase [Megasphaera sp. AM44-1BH]